jgi:hypothetical protein
VADGIPYGSSVPGKGENEENKGDLSKSKAVSQMFSGAKNDYWCF